MSVHEFMAWVVAIAITTVVVIWLVAVVVLGCMAFVAAVVEWADARRKKERKRADERT